MPHNPFFTGREETLEELGKALSSGRVAALTGLGGVGKTEIAARFAHQHRDEYSAVLWACGASEEALISDFAAIARRLNLPQKNEEEEGLEAGAFKRWLESHSGWLLIVDNAGDPATVQGFVPQSPKGHVLLTTRAQASDMRAIEVSEMPPEEGALLLLRRAKIIAAKSPLTAADGRACDAAQSIAKELGGLPLALEQAGAYLEQTGCGVGRYLVLCRRCRAELRKGRGGFGPEHPESVATTFVLSFERVASASRAAADLLRLCAFLHPASLAEEIFSAGAAELGPNLADVAAHPSKLEAAFAETLKYSLLRRDAEAKTFSIHPFVQEVIRNGMTEEGRGRWAKRAVRAVNQAFPLVERSNWAQCERLLPQAMAGAALVETYGIETKEAARLLNQAGLYLSERGRIARAEPLFQRALAIKEKVLGPDDPSLATTLNNLATLYNRQGKYAEAGPPLERALAIFEKALGPDHPDVAASLTSLGFVQSEQGGCAQAEPLLKRALAIKKKALGPDHPDVATSLNNLAALFDDQGKYKQAEPLYRRALAIDKKALGANHPGVARDLNNLALLNAKQGKYAEAETLYQRALAIIKKALGPDHPDVAANLNNLAALYYEQGMYAQALPLYQQALAIDEKSLGPDHPGVATDLNNLGVLYKNQGLYAQAEPLYQRALAVDEKALGPNHPGVARDLNNLALLYSEQGQYAQAEPLFQRALAINEKAFGPEHSDVATVLENYAPLLREMKHGGAARELEARAQAIRARRAKNNSAK
jgi:tetratricopeptide (TPR) repeat protein